MTHIHEDKNQTRTNVAGGITKAMRNGPQDLTPFYGEPRGFSFQKEIQPILNKHCIKCHDNEEVKPPFNNLYTKASEKTPQEMGLKPITSPDALWSVTTKKPGDNWTTQFPLPNDQKSKMGFGNVPFLEKNHHVWESPNMKDVWVTSQGPNKPLPPSPQLLPSTSSVPSISISFVKFEIWPVREARLPPT